MQEDAEDAERVAYLRIDWHDFVVVETIEFKDDDAPMNAVGAAVTALAEEGGDVEMEMEMETEAAPPQPAAAAGAPAFAADDDDPGLRVRKDYVPQVRHARRCCCAVDAARSCEGVVSPGLRRAACCRVGDLCRFGAR